MRFPVAFVTLVAERIWIEVMLSVHYVACLLKKHMLVGDQGQDHHLVRLMEDCSTTAEVQTDSIFDFLVVTYSLRASDPLWLLLERSGQRECQDQEDSLRQRRISRNVASRTQCHVGAVWAILTMCWYLNEESHITSWNQHFLVVITPLGFAIFNYPLNPALPLHDVFDLFRRRFP